jgi:hypothetical protein
MRTNTAALAGLLPVGAAAGEWRKPEWSCFCRRPQIERLIEN